MENVIYIFPACYGMRQNQKKHENFRASFILSFRVQRLTALFYFLDFALGQGGEVGVNKAV